jgi:predicted dehydrogenase
MSNQPLRVGLVGFGTVAERFHAPLISFEPAFRLSYVVERHRERSRELYPQVTVLRSLDEMLRTTVDLVVVLTPNESHFELAHKALSAGKHVVIDKPMTVSSEQADELISLAVRKGLTLSVFHNRRWDSDFLTLKSLLKSRTLGKIVELESRFDRFRPQPKGGWREKSGVGTGVLYDIGSHLVDQALVLFGLPRAVWADVQVQRDGVSADDWFRVLLDYPETRVCLRASCLAAGPMVRFCVRGTKGTWIKHGLDSQEFDLAEGRLPGENGWGVEDEENWGVIYRADEEQKTRSLPGHYTEFYRLLAQSLEDGSEPPVRPGEARDVVRCLELCLKSCETGSWVAWS